MATRAVLDEKRSQEAKGAECLAVLLSSLAQMLRLLLATAGLALLVSSCTFEHNTDATEGYYHKAGAKTPDECCAICSSDPRCNFATHTGYSNECYLKDANSTTRRGKDQVTLVVVRPQPSPAPTPPPTPFPPLPAAKYKVTLVEHSAVPAISFANAKGKGNSPCQTTFNPAYVEVAGENKVGGVILRTDDCEATNGALSFAPCDVQTGVCGDLDPSYRIDKSLGTQDPRVVYDPFTQYFYNFAYGRAVAADGCGTHGEPGGTGACTVLLSRTKTPTNASSWTHVSGGTFPWHRNGCCHVRPAGERTYCIFGESGSTGAGSGLGIAYTTDMASGRFTQTNWTAGVPGPGGRGLWMQALGADQQEVKLEAGAHMMELESGDLLHFYAAATPGWVPNGNYTAGYIILDKDEPTRIIQRGSGQFMIPTFDYETLCNGSKDCKYHGERKNVIFLSSAARIGPNRFRLFFGGGDGNVGTGVVEVSDI